MQPPRSRTPRIDLGDTETLRSLILNGTAAVTTVLLFRFATLLVSDSSDNVITGYVQLVTEPLVWPFKFFPILGDEVLANATLVDLMIVPGIALIGVMVAGILTGWQDSGRRSRGYTAHRE